METLLHELLARLAEIGEGHDEVYDSEVRERMRDAISNGFLRSVPGFEMPAKFGMYSEKGNQLVRRALAKYVVEANKKAEELGLDFRARYAAFQNEEIVVGSKEVTYGDFFGYVPPENYDEKGNENTSH
jgi:hypothetical protein